MAKKSGNKELDSKKLSVPTEVFEIDGKKYRFNVAKFVAPAVGEQESKEVLAKDALKNADLLYELVNIGAGIIEHEDGSAVEAKKTLSKEAAAKDKESKLDEALNRLSIIAEQLSKAQEGKEGK